MTVAERHTNSPLYKHFVGALRTKLQASYVQSVLVLPEGRQPNNSTVLAYNTGYSNPDYVPNVVVWNLPQATILDAPVLKYRY
jgi:hypothetical protein